MISIWHKNSEIPAIGRAIIVQTIHKAYIQYLVSDATVQQEIVNDATIEQWAYVLDFAQNNARADKLLSGIKEGNDNDWAPINNGYMQFEYDIHMLKQQINGRIQTLPNEVDGFSGIDYMNIIFGNTSIEQKAATFVDIIQNIPAVKDVIFINAQWVDKKSGVFQFTFKIQSIFGDLDFQIGLDAQNRAVITHN